MRSGVLIVVLFLALAARGDDTKCQFTQPFTREAIREWCSVARTQADVKQCFGAGPMITASLEETDDPELFRADSVRFSYPIEVQTDGRMSIGGSFAPGRTALLFRFKAESLVEVFLFHSLSDTPNEMIWRMQRKESQPNQALQTTPMTRSVYEKTIEFGHPQRGV